MQWIVADPVIQATLRFQIKVRVQINIQGGKFENSNKHTGLNKHTGWRNSNENTLTGSKTRQKY